jgi:MFS family permease
MFTLSYKRYVLAALTTVYAVNLFDRGLMFMLLQPIKEDLVLSDTQLGLLTGIAFGVFYATLGVPIARWADRGNRVTIMALSMGVWGLTAIGCGFVSSYVQLVVARVLAGVGDAGCQPPTYSLLGDYFPGAAERTRAMYIWFLAPPVSCLVCFATGGWVNEHYGWRTAFVLTGILGVVLTILIKLTLAEPRARVRPTVAPPPAPPFINVLHILWRQRSCRHLMIAGTLLMIVGQGAVTWQAAFLIRNHGMGTAELGLTMGLIVGIGGTASLLTGSYIVSRWFTGNEPAQLRLLAFAVACGTPIFITFLTATEKEVALFALLLQTIAFTIFSAPTAVMLQRLVPDDMRATVNLTLQFFSTLIGMGIGPLLVGSLSDIFRPQLGDDALRYAMMLMSVLWPVTAYYYVKVGRTISEDIENVAQYKAA